MPRPDKATFIQNMLSELEHQQNGSAPASPTPDSKEWWREVAQELGVKANESARAYEALRVELGMAKAGHREEAEAGAAHLARADQAERDLAAARAEVARLQARWTARMEADDRAELQRAMTRPGVTNADQFGGSR